MSLPAASLSRLSENASDLPAKVLASSMASVGDPRGLARHDGAAEPTHKVANQRPICSDVVDPEGLHLPRGSRSDLGTPIAANRLGIVQCSLCPVHPPCIGALTKKKVLSFHTARSSLPPWLDASRIGARSS